MICKRLQIARTSGKDIKRSGGTNDPESVDSIKAVAEPVDFAVESSHIIVAGLGVVLQCRLRGSLRERRAARGGGVDQLADRIHDGRRRDGEIRSASRSCCTTC